jgi:hypothetical protein
MLAEYALIPDIFDSTNYSSEEVRDLHVSQLTRVLLEEALVRDLRDGEWLAYISAEDRPWHRRAKELAKKLIKENRLRRVRARLSDRPLTNEDWCREALQSRDDVEGLKGILTTNRVAAQFKAEPLVASVEKLNAARWWQDRSCSVRLERNTDAYLRCLGLVLKHARSLMFIDPHIDPEADRYGEFPRLLLAARRESVQPKIEIHRVCYAGSGKKRDVATDWHEKFCNWLDRPLRDAGLTAEVFIWFDFHDRYLVTDVVGIMLANGFDTGRARTTWTRLGRGDRDDIQGEFDPATRRHRLHKDPFTIGLPQVGVNSRWRMTLQETETALD